MFKKILNKYGDILITINDNVILNNRKKMTIAYSYLQEQTGKK